MGSACSVLARGEAQAETGRALRQICVHLGSSTAALKPFSWTPPRSRLLLREPAFEDLFCSSIHNALTSSACIPTLRESRTGCRHRWLQVKTYQPCHNRQEQMSWDFTACSETPMGGGKAKPEQLQPPVPNPPAPPWVAGAPVLPLWQVPPRQGSRALTTPSAPLLRLPACWLEGQGSTRDRLGLAGMAKAWRESIAQCSCTTTAMNHQGTANSPFSLVPSKSSTVCIAEK